jgi:hypothetical protein
MYYRRALTVTIRSATCKKEGVQIFFEDTHECNAKEESITPTQSTTTQLEESDAFRFNFLSYLVLISLC